MSGFPFFCCITENDFLWQRSENLIMLRICLAVTHQYAHGHRLARPVSMANFFVLQFIELYEENPWMATLVGRVFFCFASADVKHTKIEASKLYFHSLSATKITTKRGLRITQKNGR